MSSSFKSIFLCHNANFLHISLSARFSVYRDILVWFSIYFLFVLWTVYPWYVCYWVSSVWTNHPLIQYNICAKYKSIILRKYIYTKQSLYVFSRASIKKIDLIFNFSIFKKKEPALTITRSFYQNYITRERFLGHAYCITKKSRAILYSNLRYRLDIQ